MPDQMPLNPSDSSEMLRATSMFIKIVSSMVAQYLGWDGADVTVCRLLETLISEVGRLPLKEPSSAPECIVNTELNSGNFLINEGAQSYLIDWEKPLLSEPAQDLGHFLAPTTTLWKTDVVLTAEEMEEFVRRYRVAVGGRFDVSSLSERLPLFLTINCLRGVSWCAMNLILFRKFYQPTGKLGLRTVIVSLTFTVEAGSHKVIHQKHTASIATASIFKNAQNSVHVSAALIVIQKKSIFPPFVNLGLD